MSKKNEGHSNAPLNFFLLSTTFVGNDIPQSGFTILAFHREFTNFTLTARNPTSRWGFVINISSLKFFVRGQLVYRCLLKYASRLS